MKYASRPPTPIEGSFDQIWYRVSNMFVHSILFGLLFFLAGCGNPRQEPASATDREDFIPFREDGRLTISRNAEPYAELVVEIAESDSSRRRGLMQRPGLPDGRGMLFLFELEAERSFWMLNTPIALDLIFIDADSTVMRVARYIQPMSGESIASNGPARFVLEVEAGYSDTIGLVEGDRVSWIRTVNHKAGREIEQTKAGEE